MTLCCAMLCLYFTLCLIMYRSAKPRFPTGLSCLHFCWNKPDKSGCAWSFDMFRSISSWCPAVDSWGLVCLTVEVDYSAWRMPPGWISPQPGHQGLVVCRVPRGAIFTSQAGPDTNGSQFFITTAAAHHLDGMETQDALRERDGLTMYHPYDGKSLVNLMPLTGKNWMATGYNGYTSHIWWNWGWFVIGFSTWSCVILGVQQIVFMEHSKGHVWEGHLGDPIFQVKCRRLYIYIIWCLKKRWSTASFHVLTKRR